MDGYNVDKHELRRVFSVEDNVPIPEPQTEETKSSYPFQSMDVGQSFFVSLETAPSMKVLQNRVKGAVSSHLRRAPGCTFTWRKVSSIRKDLQGIPVLDEADNQITVEGIRVWRTA